MDTFCRLKIGILFLKFCLLLRAQNAREQRIHTPFTQLKNGTFKSGWGPLNIIHQISNRVSITTSNELDSKSIVPVEELMNTLSS